jgi:hypothetical protein
MSLKAWDEAEETAGNHQPDSDGAEQYRTLT